MLPNNNTQLSDAAIAARKIDNKEINYHFCDALGSGSSSDVYKGTYKQKQVAIKFLALIDSDKEHILRTEIKTMVFLELNQAPNIPTFYGYTMDENGAQNLVLEYMPNGDLQTFIRKQSSQLLSISQKTQIIGDVITALAFLHAVNLIHGDVKSANILLDNVCRAKLSDFDSVVETGSALKHSTTLRWMAPEYLDDTPLTPAVDIYSVGVCLWEVVAWKRPFGDIDSWQVNIPNEVRVNNLREPIPSDCPSNIAKLITWCWKTAAHERPSAKEMQDELIKPLKP